MFGTGGQKAWIYSRAAHAWYFSLLPSGSHGSTPTTHSPDSTCQWPTHNSPTARLFSAFSWETRGRGGRRSLPLKTEPLCLHRCEHGLGNQYTLPKPVMLPSNMHTVHGKSLCSIIKPKDHMKSLSPGVLIELKRIEGKQSY